MRVTDALDAALAAMVSNPAAILPIYLVATSVTTLAAAIPLVGLVAAALVVVARGRHEDAERALSEIDFDGSREGVEPEALPGEAIAEALRAVLLPEVVAIVVLSLLAGAILYVVASAVVHAGQIHTVYAELRGEPAVPAGVTGARRDARPFVGIALLEFGSYALAIGAYAVVVAGAVWTLLAVGGPAGAIAVAGAAVLAPVWIVAVLAIAAVFVFAPQAVVVDRVGALSAVRRGAGFVRRRPAAFGAYVLIAFGLAGATGTVAAGFAALGAPLAATVLSTFVVAPFAHLLKTGIYAEGDAIAVRPLLDEDRETPGVRTRVRRAGERATAALGLFVRRSPGGLALSAASFVLGVAGGYWALADLGATVAPPEEPAAVFGPLPVGTFVTIAINNWLVAVGVAYAGIAFGIPTAVVLAGNGAILGAVFAVTTHPVLTAALIVPHALIEIPAIVIGGALGFRLARVALARVRERLDDGALAGEITRAFWVLVGLAVVFVVAAFVEAFITPWIAASVG